MAGLWDPGSKVRPFDYTGPWQTSRVDQQYWKLLCEAQGSLRIKNTACSWLSWLDRHDIQQ